MSNIETTKTLPFFAEQDEDLLGRSIINNELTREAFDRVKHMTLLNGQPIFKWVGERTESGLLKWNEDDLLVIDYKMVAKHVPISDEMAKALETRSKVTQVMPDVIYLNIMERGLELDINRNS